MRLGRQREEYRHDEYDGYYREEHAAHYTYRKAEPELVLLSVKQERDKTQYCTQYGKHGGYDLAVVCLDVGLYPVLSCGRRYGPILGRKVDTCIHRNTVGYARNSPMKLTGMSSTTISGTLNDSNNEAQIMKITSTTTNMSAVRCLCSLHQP